jgi:hypothetical protein
MCTVTRVAVALVLVVTLAACGGRSTRRAATGGARTDALVSVDSVLPLRAAFNADRGHPRLLLLFSPT